MLTLMQVLRVWRWDHNTMSQTKRATSHNRLLNYQPLLSEREFASSREWGGGGRAMSPTRCPKIILSRQTTFSANKSRGVRSGGSRKVGEGTCNNSTHFEFFSGRKCLTHTHTHVTREWWSVMIRRKRGGGGRESVSSYILPSPLSLPAHHHARRVVKMTGDE